VFFFDFINHTDGVTLKIDGSSVLTGPLTLEYLSPLTS